MMGHLKIFYCKKCRALDYAEGRCPKCGSAEIDEADAEFLSSGSSTLQSTIMPILWTQIHPIEKFGWN